MKKKTLLMMSGVLALAITPLLLLPLIQHSPIYSIKGNNAPYYLRINNTTNKYTSGNTYVVKTDRGTDISFTASNLSSHENYAFTMDNGAYLYNTTIINGLMSMQMEFEGAVDVYFGDEANPSASHATLTSGSTFNFHGDYPTYLKLEATAVTNVESVVLIYDCLPILSKLEFVDNGAGYTVSPTASTLSSAQIINIPDLYLGEPVTIMQGFEDCAALEEIYIGKNIEYIFDSEGNDDYFIDNFTLKAFNVSLENSTFSSLDGILYNADGEYLYRYPANRDGTSLTINSIQSTTTVYDNAFKGALNLTSINTGKAEYISEHAFDAMPNLEEFTFSTITTSVDGEVFCDCPKLTEIDIPTTLTSGLSLSAFDNAIALETINVHAGNSAFKSIDGMLCDKTNHLLRCPEGRTFGEENLYTVDEGITGIGIEGVQPFKNVEGLLKIVIPSTVTSISTTAFDGAYMLYDITVSGGTNYSSESGVLYNSDKTKLIRFPEGKGQAFAVPPSVEILGSRCFACTWNLIDLTIHGDITTIEASIFDDDDENPCEKLFVEYYGSASDFNDLIGYDSSYLGTRNVQIECIGTDV